MLLPFFSFFSSKSKKEKEGDKEEESTAVDTNLPVATTPPFVQKQTPPPIHQQQPQQQQQHQQPKQPLHSSRVHVPVTPNSGGQRSNPFTKPVTPQQTRQPPPAQNANPPPIFKAKTTPQVTRPVVEKQAASISSNLHQSTVTSKAPVPRPPLMTATYLAWRDERPQWNEKKKVTIRVLSWFQISLSINMSLFFIYSDVGLFL
jgi:hypothetical protein